MRKELICLRNGEIFLRYEHVMLYMEWNKCSNNETMNENKKIIFSLFITTIIIPSHRFTRPNISRIFRCMKILIYWFQSGVGDFLCTFSTLNPHISIKFNDSYFHPPQMFELGNFGNFFTLLCVRYHWIPWKFISLSKWLNIFLFDERWEQCGGELFWFSFDFQAIFSPKSLIKNAKTVSQFHASSKTFWETTQEFSQFSLANTEKVSFSDFYWFDVARNSSGEVSHWNLLLNV